MLFWPLIIAGSLLAAYGLYRLLKHLFRKDDPPNFGFDSSSDSGSRRVSDDQWMQEAMERERERQAKLNAAKAEQINKILSGDEDVAELFTNRYSPQDSPAGLMANQERVLRIAAQIPDYELQVFNLASKQDWLEFNLEAKTELSQTLYPADKIEIEPIQDFSELEFVLPEQFLTEEDEFYRQIASNEMLVVKFFESIVRAKLLYILLDVSGSMQEQLQSGSPKHVWARGVVINLLVNAQREGGKFFFREFASDPYGLIVVENPSEMKSLANRLLQQTFDGGGTNIRSAVQTAVNDIRTKGGDLAESELLVITDGQDEMDESWLRSLLKDDINLHYVALGNDTHSASILLQKVAKTFMRFP